MISRYRSSRPGMVVTRSVRTGWGWSEAEDVRRALERIGQRVDVVAIVVDVEAGTGRGGRTEQAHQRLGAVVAGADAHVALVEDLADVVGVEVAEREAHDATAVRHVGRAVDHDVVAE